MDNRNNILKTLQARANEAREKAIAEGRAIPSVEHRNAFIEKMRARAEAQKSQLSPMTQERMNRIIERFANKAKKEE
jgi:hypothetical protein